MPDLTIGQLPNASQVDPSSLFVAEQSGNAVNVTGAQLLEFANVETAAQVQSATKSAQAAAQSAQKAQNASSAIQNLGVSAETVPPTSTAEVLKTVDPTSGTVTLEFQIPAGTPGAAGPPGADGVSPYQVAQENGYTGTEADFNSRLAQIDEMCLEPLRLTTPAMGQTAENGPLELYEFRGNTVLGGTPAYNAPVPIQNVDGPLDLRIAGKNLIPPFARQYTAETTLNGVTIKYEDGVYKLSGTATKLTFFNIVYDTERCFSLPAGTYTLSLADGSTVNTGITVTLAKNIDGSNTNLATIYSSNNKAVFSLDDNDKNIDYLLIFIRVDVGITADGTVVAPQVEVGNVQTEYAEPSGTAVEIPLTGTDGRKLEPLRMAYTGFTSNKTPAPDRIIRKDGIWYVERNVSLADLTNAVWTRETGRMVPRLNGAQIRGKTSSFPLSTHFNAAGANPETEWNTGIRVGGYIIIYDSSLPNGADTTVEEMTAWCAAQAEAGTPVLVYYARTEQVYEELHQDVQVLLNTLSVPGETCSVWFEGDVLPDVDIGLPRGDYPNAGMEGAYRWLGELSSPLSPPTQDDLYAWALMQQRGGVFSANGDVTTKNVPEGGNLTGILSVAKQGEDVSMLVFGPTGKLHAANRIAGVWRGWSALVTQEQLDAKIGEIGTQLDAINGEVV